jgi:hypothetical protein
LHGFGWVWIDFGGFGAGLGLFLRVFWGYEVGFFEYYYHVVVVFDFWGGYDNWCWGGGGEYFFT